MKEGKKEENSLSVSILHFSIYMLIGVKCWRVIRLGGESIEIVFPYTSDIENNKTKRQWPH